jgi:hypothetical protein
VDSLSYTYNPVYNTNTRGDINGNIKYQDIKRGEVAFEVPGNESEFELRFDTGNKTVKTVRFKLDVKK